MKLNTSFVVWNSETDKLLLVPSPEPGGDPIPRQVVPGDCWMPVDNAWQVPWPLLPEKEAKERNSWIGQLASLFVLFNILVVYERFPVTRVHKAFLAIDEYRDVISTEHV